MASSPDGLPQVSPACRGEHLEGDLVDRSVVGGDHDGRRGRPLLQQDRSAQAAIDVQIDLRTVLAPLDPPSDRPRVSTPDESAGDRVLACVRRTLR